MSVPFRWKSKGDLIAMEGVAEHTGAVIPVALSVAAAILLISLAARLALPVPGTPIPISLQDLAVLLTGVALGPRVGALAVAGYVLLGAGGAPVYSNGHAGLAWLMGPTGGYLLAYPMVAWLTGLAAHLYVERARWLLLVAGVLAAQGVLFLGGGLQMALLTGQGLREVLALSVTPFVPGIVLKSGLVVGFAALRTPCRPSGSAVTGEPGGSASDG